MILAKMGPHMKDEPPRTDQQICEDVLKKRRMKGIFLSDLGTTSSMTSASIPEFEEILEDHEQQSLPTSPRYQQLQARVGKHLAPRTISSFIQYSPWTSQKRYARSGVGDFPTKRDVPTRSCWSPVSVLE